MRVGFLLNHYNVHQVPHIVPYAFELSRIVGDIETAILTSTRAEEEFAREIGRGYKDHKCTFQPLNIPFSAKLLDPLLSKFVFARKHAVLRANADRLCRFDALVVPETTSFALRKIPGFENVKLIFTGHGAGDNRLGGSFNRRIGDFDLALLPGRKYADDLKEVGYLSSDNYAISGYPKFEAVKHTGVVRRRFFDNDRPTVVYNPHHARPFTSWHKMGRDILDFFYANDRYNLIFSPHVLLFERSWSHGGRLPGRYKSENGVLSDKGSRFSVDMTYLKSADLYLGDTSSQVYEFLEEPRPCVFLNAHKFDWQNDPSYRHWKLGPLIDNVSMLEQALAEAAKNHIRYEEIQRNSFTYTFKTSRQTAGVRGATIIADFLKNGRIEAKWQ